MPIDALIAVLAGALLHAGWNAAIKSGRDKSLDTVLVAIGGAAIAAAGLPFLAPPAAASLPFIGASVILQVVYFALVAAAYRTGDMSRAYPLMRGTAPLIVAVVSGPVLGEALTAAGWAGTLLICGGVLALALAGGAAAGSGASKRFALANAAVIAGYTLIDGTGVRLSGQPAAYSLWIFLLTAVPMTAWALARRRADLFAYLRARWLIGLGGGIASSASYGLALWAMTRAPIAMAAALRELSILFALLLAAGVLKERIGPPRLFAAIVITAGAVVLRLPT